MRLPNEQHKKPSLNSSVFCFSPQGDDKDSKFFFKTQPLNVEAITEGAKQRTFNGVAYSGEPITDHWYWDNVIFDLDTLQIKGRIPALLDHSPSQRAGAVNSYTATHAEGLKVSGVLLTNEYGTQIAKDSDDSFPWQMSVRINPASIEEYKAGQTVTVNGKTHQGPITVFRGGRIREVSFCSLGADDNTNAVAASHKPNQFKSNTEENDMDLAQAQARITALEAENAQLQEHNKQFAAKARTEQIKSLFSELGREFKEDDQAVKDYAAMDDKSFEFTAGQLRTMHQQFSKQQPPKTPLNPNLFSEQAVSGREAVRTSSLAERAKNH